MTDINELVLKLAQAQARRLQLEKQYAGVLLDIKMAKDAEKVADEELRAAALSEYHDSGDKKPHSAVSIRVMTEIGHTHENKIRALTDYPQALVIDPDKWKSLAQELAPQLLKSHPSLVTLNTYQLKRNIAEDRAKLYSPIYVPRIFVQSKLGEYANEETSQIQF